MPTDTVPVSPRISALERAFEAGETAALGEFWDEVAARGAPLVEPLADDPDRALVTFLWREAGPTRSVVVFGGPTRSMDPLKGELRHIAGSDLWHRTYFLSMDARTQYVLSPNDPLTPVSATMPHDELVARMAGLVADPLNPHKIEMLDMSVIEMPKAPPQPWVARRDGVPEGKVEVHTVASRILGNERKVWVYTPPGYSGASGDNALLLVFDGEAYTKIVPTPTVLDNLLAEGRIPPMIAVLPSFVDQPTRMKELPCYAPHADFVVKELLFWVRERYRITRDSSLTFVGGSSYGGLASTYLALRYPRVFGNVLSQSGSYWWKPDADEEPEWLARQFASRRRLPVRFYMDVGRLEDSTETSPVSQLISNRHLRDVLVAKRYPLHYVEYSGGHDYVVWRGTLADGLLALLEMRAG